MVVQNLQGQIKMTVVNFLDVKYKGLELHEPFIRSGDNIILKLPMAKALTKGTHHLTVPPVIKSAGCLRGKKLSLSAGSILSGKSVLMLNAGQVYSAGDWKKEQHISITVLFDTVIECVGVLHIL